jgi:hypothetical protein
MISTVVSCGQLSSEDDENILVSWVLLFVFSSFARVFSVRLGCTVLRFLSYNFSFGKKTSMLYIG